jgi:hypothetical protein
MMMKYVTDEITLFGGTWENTLPKLLWMHKTCIASNSSINKHKQQKETELSLAESLQ